MPEIGNQWQFDAVTETTLQKFAHGATEVSEKQAQQQWKASAAGLKFVCKNDIRHQELKYWWCVLKKISNKHKEVSCKLF